MAFYLATGQTSMRIGDFDISETKGPSVRVVSGGAQNGTELMGHWSQISLDIFSRKAVCMTRELALLYG